MIRGDNQGASIQGEVNWVTQLRAGEAETRTVTPTTR